MNNLSSKHCVPCEGGVRPFDQKTALIYLRRVRGWRLVGGKSIEKEFTFSDFSGAIGFVNRVAPLAEKEGHHPDILLYDYKRVRLTISTHAIGGLSENDFILAAKIDNL